MDQTYIALLRGINVGGKNKLAMKDLTALLVEAGGREVTTYIQSGNAVFCMDEARAPGLAGDLAARIKAATGLSVPVVLRSVEALAGAVRENPLLAEGLDPEALHVMFLADMPASEDLAKLDPERSPGDRYLVRGREVFLHCPQGVAGSKLTNAYFDSKLQTVSTSRNWRTVNKLLEMAEARHAAP